MEDRVVYSSNNSGDFIVDKFVSYGEVYVKFIKTGTIVKTQMGHVVRGGVKDPYNPIVYGKGFMGLEKNKRKDNSYRIWEGMLRRCYSETESDNTKYYKGREVTVAEVWHNFENFRKFYYANYVEGYELDKDLLGKGNLYSPDTTVFIPKSLNNNLKLGKGYTIKGGKYNARITNSGKTKSLGVFPDKLDAQLAYLRAKEGILKEMAETYRGILSDQIIQTLENIVLRVEDLEGMEL